MRAWLRVRRKEKEYGRHLSAPNENIFTAASLFAGIGGFCRAFEDAGFNVLWANENDPYAIRTYVHNFPDVILHKKSIRDLSVVTDELEPVDIITAGFPCQAFSVAGSQRGFSDHRGKLFFEIIRILREYGKRRPKIVIMENVKNLLFHDDGRTFERIVEEIQLSGYWFTAKNVCVLNTKDHTDIPQTRERLFMVALSWEAFKCNDFSFPDRNSELRDVRSFLDTSEPADQEYYFDRSSKYGRLFADSMSVGNPDSVYLLRRCYVRENKTDTVFTLTANMGEGGHNVPVIKDNWGIRKLTPNECLRLQGFNPDEFGFPSDMPKRQQYKQIGNTVTLPLVQMIAEQCKLKLIESERLTA